MSASPCNPVTLAMTGASGSVYGLRVLECLLRLGRPVDLLISAAARIVLSTETDLHPPEDPTALPAFFGESFGVAPALLRAYGPQDWMAPAASGSNPNTAMVVCPCSGGTVSAIAAGASDNLIERAADVILKEKRPLILVLRETPLSAIHLENLLKLARMGVTIMPAAPGFYHRPRRVEDLVDFMAARVLDHLGVEHRLIQRWGDGRPASGNEI